MDFYPTRYSDLTNSEVNELYRNETWNSLSRDERLDALQELENRSAEACGNQPCEVKLEPMNGYQYGGYLNGEITLNENLVTNGEFVTNHHDGSIEREFVIDINAQMMDTIHHENYHAYQDDVINRRIEHDNAAEAELWRANDEDYRTSDDPSDCYRIQSLEKSAFEHGETQTKVAFEKIESKYGEDAGYQEYLSSVDKYSYENALAKAKETNRDDNIEENLNNQMLASYQTIHAEEFAVNNGSSTDTSSSTDVTQSNDSAVSASLPIEQSSYDIEDSL